MIKQNHHRIQIMAWCRIGTKPLSKPMMKQFTDPLFPPLGPNELMEGLTYTYMVRLRSVFLDITRWTPGATASSSNHKIYIYWENERMFSRTRLPLDRWWITRILRVHWAYNSLHKHICYKLHEKQRRYVSQRSSTMTQFIQKIYDYWYSISFRYGR